MSTDVLGRPDTPSLRAQYRPVSDRACGKGTTGGISSGSPQGCESSPCRRGGPLTGLEGRGVTKSTGPGTVRGDPCVVDSHPSTTRDTDRGEVPSQARPEDRDGSLGRFGPSWAPPEPVHPTSAGGQGRRRDRSEGSRCETTDLGGTTEGVQGPTGGTRFRH